VRLPLEPADSVSMKARDVLGAEIIDVPGRGQPDCRGKTAKADREFTVAVEQPMN